MPWSDSGLSWKSFLLPKEIRKVLAIQVSILQRKKKVED